MTDISNGWHFRHGLDRDFMKKLKFLAEEGGWFADVLADPDLITGIRNNYMNVYWRGQSLFKIEWNGENGPLKFSTHPKYLVNPELSKAVTFTGSDFQLDGHEAFTTEYGPETLGRMKQAAKLYVKGEKKGVHAVMRARANPNVIDTEVAFNSEAMEDENQPLIPRIDLACFDEVKGEIRLRFWEAKLYGNPDLRAAGAKDAPVIEQVRRYRELIEKHREEIVSSYCVVAGNLAKMARWVTYSRKIGELVERVAGGTAVSIETVPFVGLIVYHFDADQRDGHRWETHRAKLGDIPIVAAGNAKNIKLRWPHSAPTLLTRLT